MYKFTRSPRWTIVTLPIIAVAVCSLYSLTPATAQETPGELPTPPSSDTSDVIVFDSPRPLIREEVVQKEYKNSWGLDILFSGNGFGFGSYYTREFSKNLTGFIHFGISGAQNTDEFERFDRTVGRFLVDNKVNRLFMFPLTIGTQHRLFADALTDSFRPYLQGGLGPTFIMSTPYRENRQVNGEYVEFFSSFGDASFHIRPGGFIGVGAYVGESAKSVTSVNIRYYIIPFGGDGLESIQGLPIKDFGGLFLSLSVGIRS